MYAEDANETAVGTQGLLRGRRDDRNTHILHTLNVESTHCICIHVQRKLMIQQLGLKDCSVGGAMIGQLRLLLACYAVTLGALIAGSPQPESLPRDPD